MALQTTPEWRDGILAQFRYPGHAKVVFKIKPVLDYGAVEVETADTFSITETGALLSDNAVAYEPVATFEGNWLADGSRYLPSLDPDENSSLPWWSNYLIETKNVVLELTLPKVTSIAGFTMVWDNMFTSWPTQLTVYGYDVNDELIGSYYIDSIHSAQSVVDAGFENVMRVVFEISGWSNPDYRIRISSIGLGVTVTVNDDSINTISETTKLSRIMEALPTEISTIALRNMVYYEVVARNMTIEAPLAAPFVNIARLLNGNPVNGGPVASLEENYWRLDGSFYLASEYSSLNLQLPWASATTEFNSEHPIVLHVTFNTAITVNRIKVVWDNVTGSYPTDFEIRCEMEDHTVVFEKAYQATNVDSNLLDAFGTMKYMDITINTWSVAGWRARISQLEVMYMYGNSLIPSVVNNLFDPTFNQGYSRFLSKHQQILVYYGQELTPGVTTWLGQQTRFLKSWSIPSNSTEAVFETGSRLEFLTQEFTKGTYTGSDRSLGAIAQYVLEHSEVLLDDTTSTPWIIDDDYNVIMTNAPIIPLATNAMLQLIAQAGCGLLMTDPETGYIFLTNGVNQTEYAVTRSSLLGDPKVIFESPLRSLSVNVYTYTSDTVSIELYSSIIRLSGVQTIRVKYGGDKIATDVGATVIGGNLITAEYFVGYAELTIDADTEADISISITGYELKSSATRLVYYLDNVITSGQDILVDNPLVTNTELAELIADHMLEYYLWRKRIEAPYLGAPDIKAGDALFVYSNYLNGNVLLLEHTLRYNGGYEGSFVAALQEVD